MPRYEHVSGSSSKFWEIKLVKNRYVVTYGKLGTDGHSRTKEFADEVTAKKKYDAIIKTKLKRGYALVAGQDEEDNVAHENVDGEVVPEIKGDETSDPAPSLPASIEQSFADIVEWFTDHGATAKVNDLCGPPLPGTLEAVEANLGARLPPALRALYQVHNGQEHMESHTFFSDRTAFLSLSMGLRETKDMVTLLAQHISDGRFEGKERPRDGELDDPGWFCFGWGPSYHTVNLKTGRVFVFWRPYEIEIIAESFEEYLYNYANDLFDSD